MAQVGSVRSRGIRVYPARVFHETVSFGGTSFSWDETRILLTSDETGVLNVYSQPVAGGARTPLTRSTTESIRGLSWFPKDDRFLYMADKGGNERMHVFVQAEDGQVIDLTPGADVRANFSGWSGDKASFYITTNERNQQAFDLYRYDAESYDRTLVWENDGSYLPGSVSRDERWLGLTRVASNVDGDVFLANLVTGDIGHVTPHQGAVEHRMAGFTPDSQRVLYSTNGRGEFTEIWAYDIDTQEHAVVARDDWDVWGVYFSEFGRYRVTVTNVDASTVVSIVDTRTNDVLRVPSLPLGDIVGVGFAPSETKIAFYLTSDRAPANLWVWDLDGDAGPVQVTDSLNPEIDPAHLVGTDVVRYPSFDDLEIPAVLWRPHGASPDHPVPALVWVHGGPGGQTRRSYDATVQHLVNHGYAVLGVNNRGSSGYGKTFHHMDDRRHGEVDLQDCVWARRYLESLDWVDGERVGIIGGSYGGYMVVAALAFEPEAFDVGVDIFGVTNWIRTLESMPAWWGATRDALLAEMGDPETDRDRLERISPLFHADRIQRPMLVIQGRNDPRVLQVESDELVERMRADGVYVEYVLFDDEGHGFAKKENRITASEAYVEFLDSFLSEREGSGVA